MVISTLYLDKAQAVASGSDFKFSFNVYKAVKNAAAVYILNNALVRSAPCIVTGRTNGTQVLTYSSTSFYFSPENPYKMLSSDPD